MDDSVVKKAHADDEHWLPFGAGIEPDGQDADGEDARPDDYYRSQEEVDEAFKKRIAREREKWETEITEREYETEDDSDGEFEEYEQPDDFIMSLEEQQEEVRGLYPGMDIYEEMDRNPLFGIMVAEGRPLLEVMDYFYPEEARQRMLADLELQVVDRIRARNMVPQHIRSGSSGADFDVSNLTMEQLRDIDRRVQKGEKVRL